MKIKARTINANTRLTVRRLLPVKGEILVRRGQIVTPLDVVARAEISHRFQVINVSRKLGRAPVDMEQVMLKAEGEPVK
ncbi:MAG: hypothetical protein R3264_20145, partial [Anaerolineae bacterium]|nr:hypothetical protein [Anaerolineae bacterium]